MLARAEADVHGGEPDRVILHELSGVDTLVDICGAFALLDAMGIERVACSPLPYAGRSRPTSHSHLPGPGPAVLRILHDAPWVGVDAPDELVTPTGAAIVAVAADSWGALPAMTLADVGYGAGTRDPAERANVLRVVVGTSADDGADASFGTDRVVLVEANVDDMIAELVPDAMQACVAAGALDAWSAPATMKKGRPGLIVSAIARPNAERDVVTAMFEHTSTLGVRVTPLRRYELDRAFEVVEVRGHEIRVKIGRLDGRVVNVAPEHDDCASVASRTATSTKQSLGGGAGRHRADRGGRRRRPGSLSSKASSRRSDSAIVAFSGGVDSSLVAAVAARALGSRAIAITAVSPALASGELDGAREVARAVGIAHETIATDELARDGYRRNDRDRCYHCKTELYTSLATIASERGYATLLSGANADDLGDWRPGLRAAAEHGVLHPLVEAGMGKGGDQGARAGAGDPERREAGRAVPRLAAPVRHGGGAGGPAAGGPGRDRGACARVPGPAGAPPRLERPGRVCPPTTCDGCTSAARERTWSRPSSRPATPRRGSRTNRCGRARSTTACVRSRSSIAQ